MPNYRLPHSLLRLTLKKIIPHILLVMLTSLSSSVHSEEAKSEKKSQRKMITVEVVPITNQTIRAIVYGQGTVRSVRREFLAFESEGKITFIKKGRGGRDLAAGDYVEKDELLASVDKRSSLAQLDISQASLDQAKQKKISAQTDLEKAKAERKVAQADLKRTRELVRIQAMASQELDKSEAVAEKANAAVKAAMAGVEAAISGITSAKAQQVQPALGLEDTSILAPMDGIVAFVNIREGQYFSKQRVNITSESSALATTPIVIIDPSEFEVVLDIPTFQGTAVKPGQSAYIFTGGLLGIAEAKGMSGMDAESGAIKGEVFSVSPAINPGGRSIQVKVRIKLEKDTLLDGMFVNCWLVVKEHADVVVVPYNTISYEGKEAFVFVFDKDSGAVERREVTRGIRGLNGIEIVDGLKVGDQVVGKGHNRLTHGTRVEVVAVRGEKR